MNTENTAQEEVNFIVLTDENGNEVEFEFLDLLVYEGDESAVLIPPHDDSVVILKVEANEDGETENYIGIDNEDLLRALFEIFKRNNADLYDFEN